MSQAEVKQNVTQLLSTMFSHALLTSENSTAGVANHPEPKSRSV
jgi:hypothetical protein